MNLIKMMLLTAFIYCFVIVIAIQKYINYGVRKHYKSIAKYATKFIKFLKKDWRR